jgi:UDPglucose 6-dehydrogenase
VKEAVNGVAKHPFAVASNPEFLKEGDAVNDFRKPARVVVGVDDTKALEILRDVYRGVVRTNDRLHVMDIHSAEITKYASNCMLAVRISFMNELSRLCETVGADIEAVRKGMGADPRIGNKFLFAGAGFGGSCFPKDLRALVHTAQEHDLALGVIESAIRANDRQKKLMGEKILAHFGGNLSGKKIAVWGLAFKPETDDIRESPALVTIEQLQKAGATVAAYDPEAMTNVRAQLGNTIELTKDAYAAATGADALVLITEWHELRNPDLVRLKQVMKSTTLFDGRNVWSPEEMRGAGFKYFGIGRP